MGTTRGLIEPVIAFCVREHDDPALEVRVNFGMYAGREATPAEIDDLARALHEQLESFTVVAEDRHQFGGAVEASIHQVVVEVERDLTGGDADAMCDQIVAIADRWANNCIAARHVDVPDL
jgi:hypothetical protein